MVESPDDIPWRCFHCNELFTDREEAEEHFGPDCMDDTPCIEAKTADLVKLITTNRELFRDLMKTRDEAETAEFQAHCWEQAARMFLNKPNANWHDLARHKEDRLGKELAASEILSVLPRWFQQWCRRRAERLWKRRNR